MAAQLLTLKAPTKMQAEAAAALGVKLERAGGALAVALEAPRLGEDFAGWTAMADAVAITGTALVEMLASPIGCERDTNWTLSQRDPLTY